MSDDARSGGDAGSVRHLSDEQLNAFLENELSPNERSEVVGHLGTCFDCQNTLDQLVLLTTMLGELPQVSVPRSFQLPAEASRKSSSLVDRLGNWLLPALPVLRTATLVLLLAFGGVSLARVLQDVPEDASPMNSAMVVPATTTSSEEVATVKQMVPTSAETAADGNLDAAPAATSDAALTSETDAFDSSRSSDQSEPADSAPGEQSDAAGAPPDAEESGVDDDLAMEYAEESTEPESSDDVSMMKAPEGEVETQGASPSPAPASPSPDATPESTSAANTADNKATASEQGQPWGVIQAFLLAMIGLLAIGIVIARRSKPGNRE